MTPAPAGVFYVMSNMGGDQHASSHIKAFSWVPETFKLDGSALVFSEIVYGSK